MPDLRKVKYCQKGWFGGTEANAPVSIKDGLFHGFYQSGSAEYGLDPVAIVECLDGSVVEVGTRQMIFDV